MDAEYDKTIREKLTDLKKEFEKAKDRTGIVHVALLSVPDWARLYFLSTKSKK